jgi:hypothetical protein
MKKIFITMILCIIPHLCEAKDSADLALENAKTVGNHSVITIYGGTPLSGAAQSILRIKDAFEKQHPECSRVVWQISVSLNDVILFADCDKKK